MTKFRKGDVVTIEGTIDSDYVHEGMIKVRVEPYHDFFAQLSDITMKRPSIVVGDLVWLPDKDTKHATVLAIGEDHVWVSFGDGNYATWYVPLVQRLDLEPTAEPSTEEAA